MTAAIGVDVWRILVGVISAADAEQDVIGYNDTLINTLKWEFSALGMTMMFELAKLHEYELHGYDCHAVSRYYLRICADMADIYVTKHGLPAWKRN